MRFIGVVVALCLITIGITVTSSRSSQDMDSRYTAAAKLPLDSAYRGVSGGGDPDPSIPPPSYVVGGGSGGAPRLPDRGVPSQQPLDPDDPRNPE